MKIAIVIPARIGSTRLREKAILDIQGEEMITRVLKRAVMSNAGDVFVATDDEKIKRIVEFNKGKVVMTDSDLESGTDRVYSAIKKIDKKYDIVVNLQGDMPNIQPYIIKETIQVLKNTNADISTAIAKIIDPSTIQNTSVVKPILEKMEGQKYIKTLDFLRDVRHINMNNENYYHHLGIYAYRLSALERFVNFEPTFREKNERLEQLRALENGMAIYAAVVNHIPFSVDTASDLEKVRNLPDLDFIAS